MKRPSQNSAGKTYEELLEENFQLKKTVAELQKIEARLIEKETQLRTIVENFPFDVFAIDTNGRYIMQNAACQQHWGNIIGKRPKDIGVDKETQKLWEDNNSRAFSGESVEGEVVMRPHGDKRIFYNVISPIHESGRIRGILGVNIDITKHKQAANALRESEEKFRSLTEQSPSMIFISVKGKVVYCNKKCEDLLGYSKEEFCSLDFEFLDLISDECKEKVKAAYKKHLKGHEVEPYEYRLVSKNGEKLDAIITTKLIKYKEESAILGIVTDITRRKKMEEVLLARKQELTSKAHDLEEMNAALRVLLKKRESDKVEFEENIQFNVKQLIEPYLDSLNNTQLSSKQSTLLGIIKNNLDEIISPFSRNFSSIKYRLTPQEIKIASLIRQGKTTKNIAELMGLSMRTIEFHRTKIRHKLGLKNKSNSLQAHLLSLNSY